ncbi:uncharacterized protein E0L32_011365 [Thyridium curvatum]|uniref:LYR motif-containing protein Cup1-like N-terminal domain-containing protein n=1 Tax=Thyridium curvatum TaxID=1093900 RepID=A0A507B9H1_9PEZI|nr:uncharacterized protein E0L32_011365 [Thyridium curvatum]TPX18972.1 hypothetical protein E0L32_011365 [Thyridium curvatum]
MPPPTRLLDPQNPVHLYRHLLREASYLPPVCRPYISGRISASFRRHRRPNLVPSSTMPSATPEQLNAVRTKRRLREGNHSLRVLRAANLGDLSRMRRVLLLSAGRLGRRRHELLQPWLKAEPPADADALEASMQQQQQRDKKSREALESNGEGDKDVGKKGRRKGERRRDWLDAIDTDKLLAFALSQAHHRMPNVGRPVLKASQLDPSRAVPAVNVWDRPFPAHTARTKVKRWWRLLINRVVPPVGKGEFDLWRDLAEGRKEGSPEWSLPARRSPAAAEQVAEQEHEARWKWEDVVTKPVRMLERPRARKFKALDGDIGVDGAGPAIGVHKMTNRLWRRLYRQVWEAMATMDKMPAQEGKKRRWDIVWGGAAKAFTLPSPPPHTAFFEGVDAKGRLLDPKSASKADAPEKPKRGA